MSSRPEDTPLRGKSPLRCAAISPQKETPAGQRSPARLACRRPDGAEARRRPRIERATHKCRLQLPESFIRERRVKDGAISRIGKLRATVGKYWCCGRGLNSRPLPYQGSALPLSYRSLRRARRWASPSPFKTQQRDAPKDCLVYPLAVAVELGGGILMLVGLFTRPAAVVLGLWCIATAIVGHSDFGDRNMEIHFMKNLTMAGGFAYVVLLGAGAFSLDALLGKRRELAAA